MELWTKQSGCMDELTRMLNKSERGGADVVQDNGEAIEDRTSHQVI